MSYHKVLLIGNLGRDPEMRYTQSGTPVTNFSIATNERWTGQDGEKRERTIWWRISAWGKLGETVNQYLSKGRQVHVEGRMNPDPETGGPRVFTRNDGTSGSSYDVTALSVTFLGGRGDNGGQQGGEDELVETGEDDQIPF